MSPGPPGGTLPAAGVVVFFVVVDVVEVGVVNVGVGGPTAFGSVAVSVELWDSATSREERGD